MLRLEPVNGRNVWPIVNLNVREDQKGFVATNSESIIEAYIAEKFNGHAYPFGIFDDDTPVGFLMIGYGVDDYWTDAPRIAEGNYNLWRLMIDEKYQRMGYGRQAIRLALDFIHTYPCGEAECCYLSYEPENAVAKKLYNAMGFRETGEQDGEEIIAALKL